MATNFRVSQLDEVPPVPCPCGQARRAFASDSVGGDRAAAVLLSQKLIGRKVWK